MPAQQVGNHTSRQSHHAGDDLPHAGDAANLQFSQQESVPHLRQHYQEALSEPVEDAVTRSDAAQNEGGGPPYASLLLRFLYVGMCFGHSRTIRAWGIVLPECYHNLP